MFIRPALDPQSEIDGARLKIRDPLTMAFLADEGEEKPASDYWQRLLLLDGTVEVIEAPEPEPTTEEAAP